jgi:hypothetical protein
MLTVGSLLLLEAPALAHHLYGLSNPGTETSGGKLTFTGRTNCPNMVKVIFVDDRLGTAPAGPLNGGLRTISITVNDTGSNALPGIRQAFCGGTLMTLPFTGVSVLHKLAFAALLLVAGVALLVLGRRRAGAEPG